MKILTLSGALIGSALIYDRVEISEAQKEKEMKSALSKGIQPGVYYSVLDCREVELKETNNKTVRIVRVQNPWENAIEWNGDFCDDDKIWTPTMKTYFKSLSSNKENNRYVHEWYTDDGIFCIRTEDFASYFNNIYVVRDFPDNYEGVRYSSSWNPSFGYPHKKNVEWIKNAQYVFKVTDQKPVDFIFLLQQKDPRFISSNSPPYHSKLLKIGFIICKIASTEDKLVFYHESKEIFRKEPVSKRFIHGLVTLPIGKYVVIPITENAGDCSYFQLKIFFDSDFINFITPGYKVILENEEAIDPIDKFKPFDGSKVDKISDRLHKGGKYDNVLSDISSMRVRTNKNSQIDKIMKQEIKSSAWASSILIPFNCDHMVNTLKVSEEFIKAGLTSKDSKTEPNSKIKKSMIDQMGRKRDNFKAFSEEIVNDQEEIVFSGSTNDHEFKQTAYGIDAEERFTSNEELLYSKACDDTKNILDFSYYLMGDSAFIALIDIIEEQKGVECLQIQGNNLTDEAVFRLCKSLEDVHHKDIRLIDISENPSLSDKSATALCSLVARLPNLAEIRIDSCPLISKSKKSILDFKLDEKRTSLSKKDS